MEPLTSTHFIATGMVFAVSTVFGMLGLGACGEPTASLCARGGDKHVYSMLRL